MARAMSSNWVNARQRTPQSWTRQDWVTISETTRVDPYLVWADLTGYADLGGEPNAWLPIVLECKDSARDFANKHAQPWIKVHPLYTEPPDRLASTRFCTAIVTRTFFEELAADAKRGNAEPLGIKRFELALPIVSQRNIEPAAAPTKQSSHRHTRHERASCVIGIIDDGFAFAHERFRRPHDPAHPQPPQTRIDFFWDQGYFRRQQTEPDYGREYTNRDIDGYMRTHAARGIVDEDAVYRAAKYDKVDRRFEHGTFVADIAAGCNPEEHGEDAPHMILVQLHAPSRRTRDRSSGWLTARVLDGLRYILARAEQVKEACPVVVNLSFGTIAGPHDGSSIIEEAMDELIEHHRSTSANRGSLDIVIAAGNSNLSRCHATFRLARSGTGASKVLRWRVLPDDPTPNFMEIWLDDGKTVELSITTPAGEQSEPIRRGEIRTLECDGQPLCTVVFLRHVSKGKRQMALLAISPTVTDDTERRAAPAGTWQVTVKNVGHAGAQVHAWIERDDTPYDFPRHGRQSRFHDDAYQRFDSQGRLTGEDHTNESYIKRAGTINGMGTGRSTVVVGGYRRSDEAAVETDRVAVRYSSSGPGLNPDRVGPDVCAVSEDSVALHGVLSAGSRSGSVVSMNGTSVAAPQIVRELAKQRGAAFRTAQQQLRKHKPGITRPTLSAAAAFLLKDGREIVKELAAAQQPKTPPPPTYPRAPVDPGVNPTIRKRRLGQGPVEFPPPRIDRNKPLP
jgi:hypothetical protein